MIHRRRALQAAAALAIAPSVVRAADEQATDEQKTKVTNEDLQRILDAPVLNLESVRDPVKVESIELLRSGRHYLLRARSTAGAVAVTVPHPSYMPLTHPILLKRIVPTFVGQDAREIERLMWDVYRQSDNYKLQGLALWVSVAAVEICLLELLGQAARRPVADFFGGAKKRDIAVYYASGQRGNKPEEEIEYLQKLVAGCVKAIKFRLGGRMSRNADSLPGRSEALIPLVRRTFGDQMTLYADSNSSYDAEHAIRIGREMEEHGYGFFEEPCPFDDLWGTKQVADALKIPVAGGEQEFSLRRFQWAIAERGLDIVQPDLHYGGGFIRAMKVARMAAAAGMQVVPHMSGGGLGYLDVVHFASFTPNAGPFMEFKGNSELPVHCPDSSLKCEQGMVRCPAGPGFGVEIEPSFVGRAQVVRWES